MSNLPLVLGLGLLGAGAVALAVSAGSSPSTSTPNLGPWPVTVGHRYTVSIVSSQPIGTALTYAEITAAFPGAVQVEPPTPFPPGATLNVVSTGIPSGSPNTAQYTFDLLAAPTNPAGQMTAAQLAAPYSNRQGLTGSITVTVTITDNGPTPAGQGGAAGPAWARASQINPGDNVRVAVPAASFATLAASLSLPVTAAGWTQLFSNATLLKVLSPAGVMTWAPGDTTLPGDWPADDPAVASEYHAQFKYGGASAIPVASSPLVGAIVWTQPTSSTGLINPGTIYKPGLGLQPAPPIGGAGLTANLTPPGGVINVSTGAAVGAQITIAIPGGGAFTYINAKDNFPASGGKAGSQGQTPGYPLSQTLNPPVTAAPWPTGPSFVFTTTAASGEVDLLWTDAGGSTHTSTVTYA